MGQRRAGAWVSLLGPHLFPHSRFQALVLSHLGQAGARAFAQSRMGLGKLHIMLLESSLERVDVLGVWAS